MEKKTKLTISSSAKKSIKNIEIAKTKSKNAVIHVLTHSLHFAGSVFEGIGVYNRKPLLMREHYLRLLLSAKLIGIKPNKTLQQLEKISFQLIKKIKFLMDI